MLFKVPGLTGRDQAVMERIQSARRELAHLIRAPRRWSGLLRRSTLGRVIRASNSIEGYVIPKVDIVAAAAGEAVTADVATQKATETYRRAMTRVLGLATDPHFEWTAGVIKDLHYMMMEYGMDQAPGHWRSGATYVVNEKGDAVYEGPDFEKVPSLMTELVDQLRRNDSAPELVRAAMAHLNLVMVHPFKDGNGRMARCLQTLVLGRAGTVEPLFSSIEEFLGAHTGPYYDVLASVGHGSWHPENDARPWVRFCLRAHHYQAQTYLRRTRESERLMGILEEAVTKAGLLERTRLALFDAAQGFKVRNSTYRAAAEIEHQSASRDLKALVEAGFLTAEGEKKARAYMASESLVSLRRLASEGRSVIPEPYAGDAELPVMVTVTGTAATPAVFTGLPTPFATGLKPPSERSRPGDQGKAP